MVNVTGLVLVQPGASLTIGAGVTVLFTTAAASIEVRGSVSVAGTAASPVVLDGGGVASTAVFVSVRSSGATSSVAFARVSNFAGAALRNVALVSWSNFSGSVQAAAVDDGVSAAFSNCSFTGNSASGSAATAAVATGVSAGGGLATVSLIDCVFADQPRALNLASWHTVVVLLRIRIVRHWASDYAALVAVHAGSSAAFVVAADNAGLGMAFTMGGGAKVMVGCGTCGMYTVSDSSFTRNGGGGAACDGCTFLRVDASRNGGPGLARRCYPAGKGQAGSGPYCAAARRQNTAARRPG